MANKNDYDANARLLAYNGDSVAQYNIAKHYEVVEVDIREYFHADAHVNWHCSNEHFTVEEFIRANCDYPGDWDGEVEKIVTTDDMIITATRVYPKDRSASFHVTSFIKLKDDKIVAMDEYWADDGEAPKWRQDMNIGRKIE